MCIRDRNCAALAVGTLFYDIGEVRANGSGLEAETEGNVLGVYAQISAAAVLAVEFDHALPVDGLVEVHVAAVVESCMDLKNLAELALSVPIYHGLHSGVVGELAAAAYERAGSLMICFEYIVVCLFVDTEGLFAEKRFAALDNVDIEPVSYTHLSVGSDTVRVRPPPPAP